MENPVPSPRFYHFGEFTLDAHTGELSRNGTRTILRAQPLQLLLLLLSQPGELIPRDRLVSQLWPAGTFVDFDRGLNKAVNHLREALGDSAEKPSFIETLPRKGYRFVASVRSENARPFEVVSPQKPGDAPARPRRRPRIGAGVLAAALALAFAANVGGVRSRILERLHPGLPRISSVAVLPLENLGQDPGGAAFAEAMTDELITSLAKTGSVRVTSRASVMQFKGTRKNVQDIGRQLNVDAIIEGTILREGSRVRITAQLIQVSTDMHLWAEAYEQNASEILDLQREVATDIAHKVDSVIRPMEHSRRVNPEAYGLYLKARYYFYQYSSRGWQLAIEHFRKAIEVDPNFAQAYAGLADTYIVAGAYGVIPQQEALSRGKAAAQKSLLLDNNLASAHYALATAYTWYDWDWANADKEFQKALALNSEDALGRNWYGGYLSLRGRHQEAIDQFQRALLIEPFSLIVNANLARSYYWARRYDEAIAQARKTLQLDPHFGVALFWLEGSLRHRNLFREAVALRQAVHPDRSQALAQQFQAQGFSALLRDNGDDFRKSGAFVEAARCYAQAGDTQQALAMLQACHEHRCSSMVTLKAEPDFDVLHGDARYQTLVQQVGLQ